MTKDASIPTAAQAASPIPEAPRPLRAAYHAGPPTVTFAGRLWHRGKAQELTHDQWEAMRTRAAFRDLDFKPA